MPHEHSATDGERALWRVHGDAAVVLGELTPHDALVVEERLADLIELGLRRAVQARECIGIDGGGAAEFVGVGSRQQCRQERRGVRLRRPADEQAKRRGLGHLSGPLLQPNESGQVVKGIDFVV